MNNTANLACLFIVCLVCSIATAGSLSEKDLSQIRSDVTLMMESVQKGDAESLIQRTHSAAHALYGGKAAFEDASRKALAELSRSGAKIISTEVGTPASSVLGGSEEICFVPTVTIVEIDGKKARSTGFMIAARRPGAEWKYLDGAAFKDNVDRLYEFFPKLPRALRLPPIAVEML